MRDTMVCVVFSDTHLQYSTRTVHHLWVLPPAAAHQHGQVGFTRVWNTWTLQTMKMMFSTMWSKQYIVTFRIMPSCPATSVKFSCHDNQVVVTYFPINTHICDIKTANNSWAYVSNGGEGEFLHSNLSVRRLAAKFNFCSNIISQCNQSLSKCSWGEAPFWKASCTTTSVEATYNLLQLNCKRII